MPALADGKARGMGQHDRDDPGGAGTPQFPAGATSERAGLSNDLDAGAEHGDVGQDTGGGAPLDRLGGASGPSRGSPLHPGASMSAPDSEAAAPA
ncbi:MAG: hypothetical protein M3Q48_09075, partial [Actinomycetota bacterium]|nr:hypothetical protein [Actinomycetota bacterium]